MALSATSPVATSLAMLAVWLLARRITDSRRAAVAALSLEGVYYFNAAAAEFSHNVLQLAACAWLFAAAHKAFLGGGGRRAWIFLGAAAAVSLYAKYSSALFLAVLLLWSIAEPAARKQWKTSGPAAAFFVFAVLTLPQIAALAGLDFAPFQYALGRAAGAEHWSGRAVYPARFAAAQLAACALGAGLCFLARGKNGSAASLPDAERRFIFAAAFGPLLLALAVSILGGVKLRSLWGFSMLTFSPLWLLLQRRGELHFRRWKLALLGTAALAASAIPAINLGKPLFLKKGKRVHYPAAEIAQKTGAEWRARHPGAPLRYAAGETHLAALISFYSPQRPAAVMYGADWEKSFWASEKDFAKSGGVVVWVADDGKRKREKPPAFAAKYLAKGDLREFSFAWDAPGQIPPLKLGFIFVPPKEEAN